MAQVKVTVEQMRTYVRSLDERLEDKQRYPDTWCDGKISTAYEVIATRRQPFQTEEVLDLNPYILDGTEKFQVDMEYDVQGYKRIFSTIGEPSTVADPLMTGHTSGITYNVRPDPLMMGSYTSEITYNVRPDNIVDVFLEVDQLDATQDNTMTFQYYYIPTVPEAETYMSADIYHMLRHGMEFSVYEALRDMEKFQLAQSKIEDSAKTVINGLDIDIQPSDQYNGGFF